VMLIWTILNFKKACFNKFTVKLFFIITLFNFNVRDTLFPFLSLMIV